MNWKDALEGAAYGAILAGVLGQVPPFTALPEEIATIPAGAAVGAIVGGKAIKKMLRF